MIFIASIVRSPGLTLAKNVNYLDVAYIHYPYADDHLIFAHTLSSTFIHTHAYKLIKHVEKSWAQKFPAPSHCVLRRRCDMCGALPTRSMMMRVCGPSILIIVWSVSSMRLSDIYYNLTLKIFILGRIKVKNWAYVMHAYAVSSQQQQQQQ